MCLEEYLTPNCSMNSEKMITTDILFTELNQLLNTI